MESEAPADVKIFFKNMQNKLKGPYTERQVQEWYREEWFEDSTPFYFMKGDERPAEHTEFLTLDTLRTLNGIDCPFAPKKPESGNEKSEGEQVRVEKELADCSKKCDETKTLEERMENLDKILNELMTQPSPTSSSSAAAAPPVAATVPTAAMAKKKPEKQPDESSEHDRVANAWAAYYLDVLEAYKTNKWDKVDGDRFREMYVMLYPAVNREPLHLKCGDVLQKKLMELDYVYCSECDSILHNFKQIIMHAGSKTHYQTTDEVHKFQRAVNMWMGKMFFPLMMSLNKVEENHIKDVIGTHRHIDTSLPDLRPTFDFVGHIAFAYRMTLSAKNAAELYTDRDQIVAKMIDRFNKDQLGRKLMNELHEHIGDAQTRCYVCNVATGTREEYYQHLRTLTHLKKSAATDFITLVVNRYNRDAEEKCKAQPPPVASSSVAAALAQPDITRAIAAGKSTAAKKPENHEHDKLANAWSTYYLDVLEAYKTNKWDKVDRKKSHENICPLLNVGESVPLRDKCREVLLKKLTELDYAYCSECDAIFHNYKQILMHTTEPKHLLSHDALHQIQRGVNTVMKSIFSSLLKRLVKADQKQLRTALNNYASIDPASPDLRPLPSFSVGQLGITYGDAVFDYAGDVDSTRWQIVAKMIPRLKQNDSLGRKILSELHEHIGDKQTYCSFCKMVTGSRREYYNHLRTNAHLMKSNAMDLTTLVVNMFMNETD